MTQPAILDRRRFLRQCGAAAAATGIGPFAARAADATLCLPPVAVFSKVYQELKLDFRQSAELTAEAGLEGIDCTVRPQGEILPEQAADAMPRYAEALAAHGVRMLLLTTGITEVGSPHARDILTTGRKLGVHYYRLGYWPHRQGVDPEQRCNEVRACLRDLAAMNRELGLCGVLQNHSQGNSRQEGRIGRDLNEMYAVVKDLNPDEIAVAFDLSHAIVVHGDGWREQYARLKPYIRLIYVKDVRRPRQFVPFGTGEFAGTGFLHAVARSHYTAPLSMHIEYEWAPKGHQSRASLLAALRQSRQQLGRWWNGA